MIDEKNLIEFIKSKEFLHRMVRSTKSVQELLIEFIEEQPKVDVPEINVGKMIPCSCDMPKYSDELLLIQCSGKPVHNIIFENAYALASYTEEGWILEGWPEWKEPKVLAWSPLPDGYYVEPEQHSKPSWKESVLRTFLGGDT